MKGYHNMKGWILTTYEVYYKCKTFRDLSLIFYIPLIFFKSETKFYPSHTHKYKYPSGSKSIKLIPQQAEVAQVVPGRLRPRFS
jgi:hypothetical protein